MNYYTIKDLETLSGIKAHTIRIWEKRYSLLKPSRTDTNIRFYNDDELKLLLNVSLLVKHGFKISKVSDFDKERLEQEVIRVSSAPSETDDIIEQLIVCMVNFDNTQFETIFDEQVDKFGFEEAMLQIIFPLFIKIGIYWQVGSVFPAQEHFMSNLVHKRLIYNTQNLNSPVSEKTVLFFLPEGEMHELGMLFFNYLAQKEGYKTIYLGQNVPISDLENIATHAEIDLVCTGFINAVDKETITQYFEKLHEIFKKKVVLVSGNQVIQQQPEIPRNFHVVKDHSSFKESLGKYLGSK